MNLSTLFALFGEWDDVQGISQQIQMLRQVTLSLIQDVAVLQEMLRRGGHWDEELYQQLRQEIMVDDQSTAGVEPWRFHSYYPYLLTDTEFLRERLGASEADVIRFQEQVESVRSAT